MESFHNSSSTSNGSSPADSIITLCRNVEVHITGNTMGSVISDTICCFINLFMATISISSNALVIWVYAKLSSGKTSAADLLLVSLATLEIIKCGLIQPAFFIWKIMEVARVNFCYPYLFTIMGINFCSLSSFLHACCLITVERYLSVFKPILHRKPIVRKLFKIAAIFADAFCGVFLLTSFFTSEHRTYFIGASLLIISCLVATAVLYIMIRAKARTPLQNAKNITAHAASKKAADRRMNKTVITIILVSLACYLPLFSALTFLSVHERTVFHTRFVIPWVYSVTFATAAVNPFVYCWKNRRLKNEMIKFTSRVFTSNPRTFENSAVSTGSSVSTSQTTKVRESLADERI